jgi:hypothetical protein
VAANHAEADRLLAAQGREPIQKLFAKQLRADPGDVRFGGSRRADSVFIRPRVKL